MKRGMFRMAAVIQHRFGRFMLFADLHIFVLASVVFAEMGAQSTLPFVNLYHSHLGWRILPATGCF